MPAATTTTWLEALPILVVGAAAVAYGPSLGLSSTFALVGLPIAFYALAHGARRWVAILGIALNLPLAVIAMVILLPG
jgi:hypothetical protein